MILNLFVILLASVFPLSEYPSELIKELDHHFKNVESKSSLTPICTRGATRSYYFQLDLPEGSFFVKYGEKVKREVQKQLQFEKSGFPFPPLARGSSVEQGILVRPFLSEPNFGFDSVDRLYKKTLSVQEFITVQDEIFEKLFVLYHSSSTPSETLSKFFTIKLLERIESLVSDSALDSYLEKADVEGLKRDDLFNLPIMLGGKRCPSINEMVTDFKNRFEKIPELKRKYLIHGDMHPPNIAKDEKFGIVLIDLSDLQLDEDPCWDLGKWLNHINRLHPVVQRRESGEADREIIFKKEQGWIELEDKTIYPSELEKINHAAIAKMATGLEESIDLIRVREKAAEFVANINTFKRHIELFPKSTKRLLCLIVESYLEWCNEMEIYYLKQGKCHD